MPAFASEPGLGAVERRQPLPENLAPEPDYKPPSFWHVGTLSLN